MFLFLVQALKFTAIIRMKFIIIHNQYSRQGGEETVVELQKTLLTQNGHTVIQYSRRHGEVGKIASLFTSLHNRKAIREIRAVVTAQKPDVAIIHNLFPIISAAILPVLHKMGVRTIMTLHNYRLVCPNGLFYTHGNVCERCATSGNMLNCALQRCEGSLLGSIAWSIRGAWSKKALHSIDKFMALSTFQKEKITKYSNYDPSKFEIVPNCINSQSMPTSDAAKQDYVGFVGRLSKEKGIELLFETARLLPNQQFKIAGQKAENCTLTNIPTNVELVGQLDKQQLADFYTAARSIVLTSSCYEGFPLTVLEAMYYRTTVIVPRWAALPEIVGDTGVLYEPHSAQDLALKIQEKNDTTDAAYKRVVEKYNQIQYYNNIMRCV